MAEAARPMDRALEAWASGDQEGGLRRALAVLEAQKESALALLVTSYLGAKMGDAAAFADGLRAAAERAVEGGNLPLAIAAGGLARELGLDPASIFDTAAQAYGRGSGRLKRQAPPALPSSPSSPPAISESVSGAALLARAQKAARASAEALLTDAGGHGPLPPAPLFSSLDQAALRDFIELFEPKLVPAAARVVEEGTLGAEAYVVAQGEVDVTRHALSSSGPVHLARLGAGALVGEMALLSRAPRAATVASVGPALLLVASKQALDIAVRKNPELGREFAEHCRRRMLDNLVKTSQILRSVGASERTDLVQRFSIRAFEPGERLVTQGAAPAGLFLIASGEVAVVHKDQGGEDTVVARLGPGEALGEVALVLRRPAIADVIANHPTVTLLLPRERFLEAVRAHPKVFVDLYELAVRRDEETAAAAQLEAADMDDSILV
jgi:cAMP-dependent protein kinase regulator